MTPKKTNPSNGNNIILPPDAEHYINADIAVAPQNMFSRMGTNLTERPALQIVQPMSWSMPDSKKHIGEIWNTVTREYYPEVELAVVVAPSANDVPRVMKEKKYDRSGNEVYDPNARIVCGSPNGIFPFSNFPGQRIGNELGEDYKGEVIPDMCDGCLFAGNGICKPYLRYFVLQILPNQKVMPASLYIKGLSFPSGRSLNTRLQYFAERGEYWTISMTSDESSRKPGVYVPVFEPLRQITDKEFLKYIGAMNAEYYVKQEKILADGQLRLQQMQEDAEA